MFNVFATADEQTQSLAVFNTYSNTMNQNLVTLTYFNEWKE